MSIIGDSHDAICGCEQPFAHLLSNIFPIGHQDRNNTINHILWRDFKQLCHSGGDAAKGAGCPTTNTEREDNAAAIEENLDTAEDLEKLFSEREEDAAAR